MLRCGLANWPLVIPKVFIAEPPPFHPFGLNEALALTGYVEGLHKGPPVALPRFRAEPVQESLDIGGIPEVLGEKFAGRDRLRRERWQVPRNLARRLPAESCESHSGTAP